jgi:hypothetical protein
MKITNSKLQTNSKSKITNYKQKREKKGNWKGQKANWLKLQILKKLI